MISRAQVLLSLQRALLGAVFPALRQISAEWSESLVLVRAYLDGEPQEDDLETLSVVMAELAADLPEGVGVEHTVVRCDAPSPVRDAGVCVFRRQERA